MSAKFEATTITQTGSSDGTLEITLSNAAGQCTTVRVPADVARGLVKVMGDFAGTPDSAAGSLVKRPRTFAVGTGQHERAVLIRFGDDIPYAVSIDTACELANALIDACETTERTPRSRLQ